MDERSARRRDLHLTNQNTYEIQTQFEPATPGSDQALDDAAVSTERVIVSDTHSSYLTRETGG
jgi:hypothetical protein